MDVNTENLAIDLRCPITMLWLEDPIMIPCCGKAFSRSALVDWFNTGASTCPCCSAEKDPGFDPATAPKNTTLANVVESAQRVPAAPVPAPAGPVPSKVHSHQWSADLLPIGPGAATGKLILNIADSNFQMRKALFVLMVDNSGSMSGLAAEQVRSALTHIHGMSQGNKNVHIALIEYQSNATLLDFTPQNIARFIGAGGTHFRSSFQVLGQLLRGYICSDAEEDKDRSNNIGSVTVSFMTDGQDGGDKNSLVRDFKTSLNDCWIGRGYEITIHTVGFSSDCDKALLEQMRKAGTIEGAFRYAEPRDGADALCQKITDIYDISCRGTSKDVRVVTSDGTYQTRISTNEFGNGQASVWIKGQPSSVTLHTDQDNGTVVPVQVKPPSTIALHEWCSIQIDRMASDLQSQATKNLSPQLISLYCALINQRIRELRQYCDDADTPRLDFIEAQLKVLKSGKQLDVGRLSDMSFTSMFIRPSGSDTGRRTTKTLAASAVGTTTSAPAPAPAAIEPALRRENDLKHYSRLSKGKGRNQFQELICRQEYDRPMNILQEYLSLESLSYTDADGNTALMLAAHAGHSKIVARILSADPYKSGQLNVNAENNDRESAMTLAIKKRGFEATILNLAVGGAVLPTGRKKSLERYAIDHRWTRAASVIATLMEPGQAGAAVSDYSMDASMTVDYVKYLYRQAKNSNQLERYKDSYFPVLLSKGPTACLAEITELLSSGVIPTIQHLHEYCFPKKPDDVEVCNSYLELAKLLVKHNPDLLLQKDSNGETGLSMSVKCGSKPHLLWFLDQGTQHIETVNNMGITPLWSACFRGRRSFIEILLDRGANIAHQNENGNIPLYKICEQGPVELAELLISRGSPVEHFNKNGDTLILIACRSGQSEVLKCLLNYCSEKYVNHAASIDDFNAAMASAEAGHPECIRVLAEYGFNLNQKTPMDCPKVLAGATALHIAAYYGKAEAIQTLLSCGADPNSRDANGSTPLHLAVIQGYVPAILALRTVSDLTATDSAGNIAMAYCRDRADIREQLIDPALDIFMDLARGANEQAMAMLRSHTGVYGSSCFFNIRDHHGKTPLAEAALHSNFQMAKLLIEMEASCDIPDIHGMYPLTWARHNRNPRLSGLLDEHSSDQTKERVQQQIDRLQAHGDMNVLFLGQPVGDYVQMTDSGMRERMAMVPAVPSPVNPSSSFAKDLPALTTSDTAVMQYFKDEKFRQLQTTRFLWNARAFVVSVCSGNSSLVPRHVLAIAMYTNNALVSQIINSTIINGSWTAEDETTKKYTAMLLQGLRALPPYQGEVFIGLESVDRSQYRIGQEFCWDRFISASTMWRVAMEGTPSFTTNSRKGVIFAVRSKTGRLVNMCSQYGFDSELIFLPYTKFRVYSWYHGEPVALGQPNIREHSYRVEDVSASWMTTDQMVASDKALIIAVEEIA